VPQHLGPEGEGRVLQGERQLDERAYLGQPCLTADHRTALTEIGHGRADLIVLGAAPSTTGVGTAGRVSGIRKNSRRCSRAGAPTGVSTHTGP
jgi:hypothetical protein